MGKSDLLQRFLSNMVRVQNKKNRFHNHTDNINKTFRINKRYSKNKQRAEDCPCRSDIEGRFAWDEGCWIHISCSSQLCILCFQQNGAMFPIHCHLFSHRRLLLFSYRQINTWRFISWFFFLHSLPSCLFCPTDQIECAVIMSGLESSRMQG